MKYGQDAPNGRNYNPSHVPIEIIVHTMSATHTLFTENHQETIADVKRCLLNNLEYISILREIELVLISDFKEAQDNTKVSTYLNNTFYTINPSIRRLEFQLVKVEPVWERREKELLIRNSGENVSYNDNESSRMRGDISEAMIWILKNNLSMKTLKIVNVVYMDNLKMSIMRAIRNPQTQLESLHLISTSAHWAATDMKQLASSLSVNTTIKMLQIEHNYYTHDDMKVFFEMLKLNVSLETIVIRGDTFQEARYRMTDLVDSLLLNNTLHLIGLINCNVICTEDDILNLVDVLGKKTLRRLHIANNFIENGKVDPSLIKSGITERVTKHKNFEDEVDEIPSVELKLSDSNCNIQLLEWLNPDIYKK